MFALHYQLLSEINVRERVYTKNLESISILLR